MLTTSSKLRRLSVLLTACFVWLLVFSVFLMIYVRPRFFPRQSVKNWTVLLTAFFLLYRKRMPLLWEDIPRLSPRKLARPVPGSNLEHFRELWAESSEFRTICRDLGLLPIEFYHLMRVSDMIKRESSFCCEGREHFSRLERIPNNFAYEQLTLF